MAKVRITSPLIENRTSLGAVGDEVDLPDRYVRAFIRRGLVEAVDEPAPAPKAAPRPKAAEPEDLSDLTVAELQKRADAANLEPEGTGANGNVVKADLLRALQSPGKYQRRDMQAEE